MSEKYNRYVSKEITVFTVSGNGVMATGYIIFVFFYLLRFQHGLAHLRTHPTSYKLNGAVRLAMAG